ncbi:MAG: hypothetical protein P8Y00_00130 [Deltaproteobacteria bacterium]
MADRTYVGFHCFVEDSFGKGLHALSTDTVKIALSNVAPNAATDAVFTDITEISAGNGYTAGGDAVTVTSATQTGGVFTMVITSDIVQTASGGSIGPFRYPVAYNDTAASKNLIGYWDIGTAVTLEDGEHNTLELAGETLLSLAQQA